LYAFHFGEESYIYQGPTGHNSAKPTTHCARPIWVLDTSNLMSNLPRLSCSVNLTSYSSPSFFGSLHFFVIVCSQRVYQLLGFGRNSTYTNLHLSAAVLGQRALSCRFHIFEDNWSLDASWNCCCAPWIAILKRKVYPWWLSSYSKASTECWSLFYERLHCIRIRPCSTGLSQGAP
jgi:hypothetical protein